VRALRSVPVFAGFVTAIAGAVTGANLVLIVLDIARARAGRQPTPDIGAVVPSAEPAHV
jgi:hypothetical protein